MMPAPSGAARDNKRILSLVDLLSAKIKSLQIPAIRMCAFELRKTCKKSKVALRFLNYDVTLVFTMAYLTMKIKRGSDGMKGPNQILCRPRPPT
jgi:hypothetical protein